MMFYFVRPYFVKNKDGKSLDNGWKPSTGEISTSLILSNKSGYNEDPLGELNTEAVKYFNQITESTKKHHVKLIIFFF